MLENIFQIDKNNKLQKYIDIDIPMGLRTNNENLKLVCSLKKVEYPEYHACINVLNHQSLHVSSVVQVPPGERLCVPASS